MGLTDYALGVWLIVASLVWLSSVAAIVAYGIQEGRRRGGGCRGCRRDAGRQGCMAPRADGPARGDFLAEAYLRDWVDTDTIRRGR